MTTAPETNRTPLGWGAYVIQDWVSGDHISLAKNPNYFRAAEGLPKFDTLTFRFVSNPETAVSDLVAGKCDILDPSIDLDAQVSLLRSMVANKQAQVLFTQPPVMEQLVFAVRPAAYDNGYNPGYDQPNYFADARVRQAVAMCVDRQKVIDSVLLGLTTIPASYVPAEYPLYNSDVKSYAYDVAAANALLEKAGWKDLSMAAPSQRSTGPLLFHPSLSILSHPGPELPRSVNRIIPFLLLFILFGSATGQFTSPKREVRAVWLTTAAGLDWPRTTDRAAQQTALRTIIRDLHTAHFNTIFFQARARADAYYRSAYEPWAEALTGTLGSDPGWDPLRFLLTEAHAVGMEVHAWFNVFKVRGPNPMPASTPPHLTRAHPQWVILDEGGEAWVDPGNPAARRYTLDVAFDLIQNYDLDGISFDFLRYPGRVFPDAESYRRWGNGTDRDSWRRGNINQFVKEFAETARRTRPMLKIGSAPIGVYETDPVSGTQGSPQAVYQDSESWLRSGDQDYQSPQIYWNFGASRGDPDCGAHSPNAAAAHTRVSRRYSLLH